MLLWKRDEEEGFLKVSLVFLGDGGMGRARRIWIADGFFAGADLGGDVVCDVKRHVGSGLVRGHKQTERSRNSGLWSNLTFFLVNSLASLLGI